MKKDQNTTNKSIQDLSSQLGSLLDEAKKVNQDIDKTNKKARKEIDNLDSKVNGSITKVEQIYSDLNKIEKDVGDELDKLILQQSEDLARE